jgi:hypothetical protein
MVWFELSLILTISRACSILRDTCMSELLTESSRDFSLTFCSIKQLCAKWHLIEKKGKNNNLYFWVKYLVIPYIFGF